MRSSTSLSAYMASKVESYLKRLIDQETIPQSLLFAGSDQAVKSARDFAGRLVGSDSIQHHPDIYHFSPEGKLALHNMENMRALREEVYLPPYQSKRKVFIIYDAERMSPYSANALLKTFEEPLPTSYILLVSAYPNKILPTVLSRCQKIVFDELLSSQQIPSELVSLLSRLDFFDEVQILEHVAILKQWIEESLAPEEKQEPKPKIDLTAAQKLALEKEAEGTIALSESRLVHFLLEELLGWYRDLHLLHVNGDPQYLAHPAQREVLQQCLERGVLPPLDYIEDAVQTAKLHYERSSPIGSTLESLILHIKKRLI